MGIGRILDIFYPPRCIFCGKIAAGGSSRFVCTDCENTLPRAGGPERTGNPELCAAPFLYEDGVRRAILRFKFKGKTSYAAPLAEFMAEKAKEFPRMPELVTWAPVSAKRLRSRGFDQSRLLAERTAKLLGLRAECLLEKTRDTVPQSSLEGEDERTVNIRGAYRCKRPELAAGRRILLVDDIRTTGATLTECAEVLSQAGAASVYGLTLAHAKRG